MFNKKKKQIQSQSQVDFKTTNYVMKENFNSNNIIIENLEYISSTPDKNGCGPLVIRTKQKYLFELVNENGKVKYREIFTGFIAEIEKHYFDLPYVVNLEKLNEAMNVSEQIPKYAFILLVEEINKSKEKTKQRK